ncbi:MAG: tetratricopeptide repeat protein [Saprospiraceae bacterium]|nr:tetratricopeptide repeat protein [Saprospiraceae bacterium]
MKPYSLFILFIFLQSCLSAQSIDTGNSISVGEIIELESEILGETRQIFVHQPAGFWGMDEAMKNLPVVFVLDAETQFLHTVSTIDFLSAAPLGNDIIPRSLIVGIPNTNRNRDLSPIKGIIANDSTTLAVTGGGRDFLNFITEELIPFIDSNYSTSKHRTFIGHSLGGLMTFEALLRKREYFNNYISIDPALGFAEGIFMEEILDTLQNADLSAENLFFASGNTKPTFLKEEEILSDDSDFTKMISIPNRSFLNAVENNQWKINLAAKYYPVENHFSIPHQSTYDGLREFYQYYSFPEIMNYYHPRYKDKSDLVERIQDHYQMITSKMGYEVIPMEGYLNSFAFGIAPSGREDLAIALFEYNIELHPNNPLVYNNLAYYYMSKGNTKGALKAFQESLKLKSDESVLEILERLEKEVNEPDKN